MNQFDAIKIIELPDEEGVLAQSATGKTTSDEILKQSGANAKNKDRDSAPQMSEEKTAKKRVSAEKTQVYGYMKKKIVDYLEENDCSSGSVDAVIASSKFNRDAILDYLNERMLLAQKNVHEECESLCFNNIQSWLKQFKKWNLPDLCLYEHALVINSIANNEDMPEDEELEGVDLRSVYKFLGNALLGLPQAKLSAQSAKFLSKEFEILLDEANNANGDEETILLQNRLQTYKELPCSGKKDKCSIDPLCLDKVIENELKFLHNPYE